MRVWTFYIDEFLIYVHVNDDDYKRVNLPPPPSPSIKMYFVATVKVNSWFRKATRYG